MADFVDDKATGGDTQQNKGNTGAEKLFTIPAF